MKLLIVANWKCNPKTQKGAEFLFRAIKKINSQKAELIICPPFIYLPLFLKEKNKLKFGAQNCFWREGAFTGEVSAKMLKNLGCQYVIIGHSERRRYFREGNEMINKKIREALRVNLKPIFCLGETWSERKKTQTKRILKFQIKEGLKGISKKEGKNLILAYEPVWAIGTGRPCPPEKAKEVLIFLKKIFPKNHILYGGSVGAKNGPDYIKAGFDGLLVGGLSLRMKEFLQLLKNLN